MNEKNEGVVHMTLSKPHKTPGFRPIF